MTSPPAPADALAAALGNDRSLATQPATRAALALGLVGGLGEELLAALMAAPEYHAVHVDVTQIIGSAVSKFRPWLAGQGRAIAHDAFVGVTGPDTIIPSDSPIRRYTGDELLHAARIAFDAGATTLVVVVPLPALLQLGDATRTLTSEDEVALVAMGFTRVVLVRPTEAEDHRRLPLLLGLVRSMGRTLADIMLPAYSKALSARTAAAAIVEAVRAAPPGVTVVGAKELNAVVQQKMPQQAPRGPKLR
jgi:hypothetical protein